jgi:hypothetical protein
MSSVSETPVLHWFRATPKDLAGNPPLASSLQSFETTLLLLSLGRYPSALVTCASACESAIKASRRIKPDDRGNNFNKLLTDITNDHEGLKEWKPKLDRFREARNQVTHYGFSPRDDQKCGLLILEVGLPFLSDLYRELFGFLLHWRDARPGISRFMDLTEVEAERVGLLPYISDQVHLINEMHELNKDRDGFDFLHCYTVFRHFFQSMLRDTFRSAADGQAEEEAWCRAHDFEESRKAKYRRRKDAEEWDFECPMCSRGRTVVAGFDSEALGDGKVSLTWAVCVSCDLDIPADAYHLANLALRTQVASDAEAIIARMRSG